MISRLRRKIRMIVKLLPDLQVAKKEIFLLNGSGVDLPVLQNDSARLAQPIVMFIGRLLHEKGIKEFIQAARVIKKMRPTVRFIVVGDRDEHNPASVDDNFISNHNNHNVAEFFGGTGTTW